LFGYTPPKINSSNLKNDGLEDDFPLQMGACSGSMLIFPGVAFIFGVYKNYIKGVFLRCLIEEETRPRLMTEEKDGDERR